MAKPGSGHKRALNVQKRRHKAAMKQAKKDADLLKGCFSASVGCLLAPFAIFMPQKKRRKK